MKLNIHFFLLFSLIFHLSTQALSADVIYQGGTWRSEGGLSKYLIPEGKLGRNAVDLMEKAQEAQEEGNIKLALKCYDAVIEGYPLSQQAPEALYLSGRLQQERLYLENAYKRYEQIIKHYPKYPDYNKVTTALFELAQSLGRGERTRFLFNLIPWFSSRKLAIQYYESFMLYAPNSVHAPQALLDTGELYTRSGKPDKAIEVLDQLVSDYPDTQQAPQALSFMGTIQRRLVMGADYDQGANIKARDYYTDVIYLYPLSTEAEEAKEAIGEIAEEVAESRYKIGKFYWQRRNNPNARILFKEAIALSPKSEVAQKARYALEKIRNKEPAPKGLGEILLGRYKRPRSKREQKLETQVRMRQNERWQQPGTYDPRWKRHRTYASPATSS